MSRWGLGISNQGIDVFRSLKSFLCALCLFRVFGRNFSATCEEVFPWGSLPPAQGRDKNRIQLLGTAAGLYNTVCSSPKFRLSWDGMSLLPFRKHYPEPGGGRRTIRPHFIAALGQRPPRESIGETCLVAAVRPH